MCDNYLTKLKRLKAIIGAAMYVDVLKALSLLSLSLQVEKLDIVLGIQHLLKFRKSLKTMAGQDPLLWPTVCDRIKDEGGDKVYEGAVLSNYTSNHVQTRL